MDKIVFFLKQFGWLVIIALVGVSLLIYGVWGVVKGEEATVEIVKGEVTSEKGEVGEITIDVAGAVEKPGVYKLPSGSRIGDGLVVAGGISAQADREWIAKTINLAEPLKDGGKVYIPRQSENSENQRVSQSDNQNIKININTASVYELDSLVGIGTVRAETIIASRPYGNIEELISKAKIPQSVYDKIKDSVSIY